MMNPLIDIARDLTEEVSSSLMKFEKMPAEKWLQSTSAGKWTKKQILGHLVDSALNNIQRFVRGTREASFRLLYDQDQWVIAQAYADSDIHELITLWALLNNRIAVILAHFPSSQLSNVSVVGHNEMDILDIPGVAASYLDHLRHHLRQIQHD